jgi:hypothetical protein
MGMENESREEILWIQLPIPGIQHRLTAFFVFFRSTDFSQESKARQGMRVKLRTLMLGSSSNPTTAIRIQSAGVHALACSSRGGAKIG